MQSSRLQKTLCFATPQSRNPLLITLIALILAMTITGCGSGENSNTAPVEKEEAKLKDLSFSVPKKWATSCNDCGLDIFKELCKESPDANITLSPPGLFQCLSLAYIGGGGETRTSAGKIMHLGNMTIDELNSGNYEYLKSMNNTPENYEMNCALATWVKNGEDYDFVDEFSSSLEDYYHSKVSRIDMENTKETAEEVNLWIRKKTRGLLNGFPESAYRNIVTAFVSALYFKGTWLEQFDPDDTAPYDFTLKNGENIKVDMMTDYEHYVDYARTPEYYCGMLPYADQHFSLLIVMPGEKSDMPTLISSLSQEKLTSIKRSTSPEESIETRVPLYKSKYKSGRSIFETLITMGFIGDNLSNMYKKPVDKFISNVLQHNYVDINEKGTEAASATAMLGTIGESVDEVPVVKKFIVDQPYLFFLVDNRTGVLLFIGQVTDPRKH